ncbi:MAG: hypothetical protein Q8T11_00560 [Elusimicrobiota bacterium]|nr:hypothetical protein [Elusimicrobiota bacterium]
MPRIALIAAFLAASWSPAAHCLATARGAKATASCHAGATSKPAKAPTSNCAAMVCCQTVLLSAAIVAPAPESVPAPVAVATLILVPPAPPAEFAPAAPPGPPGVLLAVSLLGRAPPVA